MHNAVEIINLRKNFGKNEVFMNFSLTIPAGRVIGLLGENGIGKTTLLRIVADILKPSGGEIRVGGEIVSRKTRESVSFMPAPENFYGFMTVMDAINYFRDFFPDFDYPRAKGLCAEFSLEPDKKIKKLSKGNQERLCILLCLCRRVPLYILDEPIAGLDPKFKHESIKAMLANTSDGQTVIISSHLLRDLEAVFDEIIIVKKNSVVQAVCEDIRAQGQSVEEFYLKEVSL